MGGIDGRFWLITLALMRCQSASRERTLRSRNDPGHILVILLNETSYVKVCKHPRIFGDIPGEFQPEVESLFPSRNN